MCTARICEKHLAHAINRIMKAAHTNLDSPTVRGLIAARDAEAEAQGLWWPKKAQLHRTTNEYMRSMSYRVIKKVEECMEGWVNRDRRAQDGVVLV